MAMAASCMCECRVGGGVFDCVCVMSATLDPSHPQPVLNALALRRAMTHVTRVFGDEGAFLSYCTDVLRTHGLDPAAAVGNVEGSAATLSPSTFFIGERANSFLEPALLVQLACRALRHALVQHHPTVSLPGTCFCFLFFKSTNLRIKCGIFISTCF